MIGHYFCHGLWTCIDVISCIYSLIRMGPQTQAKRLYTWPTLPQDPPASCLTWVYLGLGSVSAVASDRPQIQAIFTQALRRNDQTPDTHHTLCPVAFPRAPITPLDNTDRSGRQSVGGWRGRVKVPVRTDRFNQVRVSDRLYLKGSLKFLVKTLTLIFWCINFVCVLHPKLNGN